MNKTKRNLIDEGRYYLKFSHNLGFATVQALENDLYINHLKEKDFKVPKYPSTLNYYFSLKVKKSLLEKNLETLLLYIDEYLEQFIHTA